MRQDGASAQVNLLLNRAPAALDIDSYLPYTGKVVLHNKGLKRITVRMPYWVARRSIRTTVSGAERPLSWIGNYLLLADLKPGDQIVIEFPVLSLRRTEQGKAVLAACDTAVDGMEEEMLRERKANERAKLRQILITCVGTLHGGFEHLDFFEQ